MRGLWTPGDLERGGGMTALAKALLTEMGDEFVAALAQAVADRVPAFVGTTDGGSPWMDADAAATYLSIGKSTLYKHQRAGLIPAYQDGPAARLFFHRDELDEYRRGTAI